MKKKALYPKIRFSRIAKPGGAHAPAKGGKYRRSKENKVSRKEIRAEQEP